MKAQAAKNLFSVTEVELVYRNKAKQSDRPKISDPSHAYDIFMSGWNKDRIRLVEEFAVLLLDRNNACIGMSKVSVGGVSSCIVDPKIVFATALKARACALILAHNHPSGNLNPSVADETLTLRFRDAGKLLDIPILDHLIVTPENYYSFTNEGYL